MLLLISYLLNINQIHIGTHELEIDINVLNHAQYINRVIILEFYKNEYSLQTLIILFVR